MSDSSKTNFLNIAQAALTAEANCVTDAARKLDQNFADLCSEILKIRGKVVTTGLGKSGVVARKIASTLSSTGTPALFLHPSEALHGDFGIIQRNDILLAVAYGGETPEVLEVAKFCRRLPIPVASITGKLTSSLAQLSDFVLDGSVSREACPLDLAPTSSALVAMALGDALGVSLMEARGFTKSDFAVLHPAGSLGRKLSCVRDHMHGLSSVPLVQESDNFVKVLETVTKFNFGIAGVLGSDTGALIGAISDGDVRRHLVEKGADSLTSSAREFMTPKPKNVSPDALAIDAITTMENNRITSLFVVEDAPDGKLIGLVRMHDLLAAKIV